MLFDIVVLGAWYSRFHGLSISAQQSVSKIATGHVTTKKQRARDDDSISTPPKTDAAAAAAATIVRLHSCSSAVPEPGLEALSMLLWPSPKKNSQDTLSVQGVVGVFRPEDV